jgi:hypothetical protein
VEVNSLDELVLTGSVLYFSTKYGTPSTAGQLIVTGLFNKEWGE